MENEQDKGTYILESTKKKHWQVREAKESN